MRQGVLHSAALHRSMPHLLTSAAAGACRGQNALASPTSATHLALCIRHEFDGQYNLMWSALPSGRGLTGWRRRIGGSGGIGASGGGIGSGGAAIASGASATGSLQLHAGLLGAHGWHRHPAQLEQQGGARALLSSGRAMAVETRSMQCAGHAVRSAAMSARFCCSARMLSWMSNEQTPQVF